MAFSLFASCLWHFLAGDRQAVQASDRRVEVWLPSQTNGPAFCPFRSLSHFDLDTETVASPGEYLSSLVRGGDLQRRERATEPHEGVAGGCDRIIQQHAGFGVD